MTRPTRIAPLLRQDRLELAGSLREAAPGWSDVLIALLLLVALAGFAQTQILAPAARQLGWNPWLGFTLGLSMAGLTIWECHRRLAAFVRDSMVASEALRHDLRLRYHIFWQAAGGSLLALLALDFGWVRRQLPPLRFGVAVALGYALALTLAGLTSLVLAHLPNRISHPTHPVAGQSYRQIVQALQLRPLPGRWPLPTMIAAGVVIGLSCLALAAASREGFGLALEIALLGVSLSGLGRIDYELWRFARFSGVPIGAALHAHLLLPLTLCLTTTIVTLPFHRWLALAALVSVLPLGWIVTLLLLLYTRLPRRQAEFRVQIEILIPLLTGLILPPLALLIVTGRLLQIGWRTQRHYWDWEPR